MRLTYNHWYLSLKSTISKFLLKNLHAVLTTLFGNRVSYISCTDLQSNLASTPTEPKQRFLSIPTSKNGFLPRVSSFYWWNISRIFNRISERNAASCMLSRNTNMFNRHEITREWLNFIISIHLNKNIPQPMEL